jgi:tetratricopeptide (TPR) repeat protein
MTLWIALASVVLAAVAAAGVLRPFGPRGAVVLERLSDPLDDERRSLLRTLRDLDAEREGGQLSESDHAALRAETEARAVALLRAIEARDGAGELAAGLKEVRAGAPAVRSARKPASSNGGADPTVGRARRVRPALPVLVVAGVLVAATIPLLVHAVSSRPATGSITGDSVGGPTDLAAAVQRVQEHPSDAAARLDLARLYVDGGDQQDAAAQYLAVVQLEPSNVEALAALGMIVYRGGKPDDGLKLVQRALAVNPNDPEALYDEGVILLQGLQQPARASGAFRAYLAAAPFGAHRQEVESLLEGLPSGG